MKTRMMTACVLILFGLPMLLFSACASWKSKPSGFTTAKISAKSGQKKETKKEKGDMIAKYGFIYKGMLKEDLKKAGFTEDKFIAYHQEGDKEFITFSDWTTSEDKDTITFVIESGKIKNWTTTGK